MAAALAAITTLGANAQAGRTSLGAHLNYGTDVENLGIGAHFRYNFTKGLRIEPSFDYYFENNGVDMYNFNVNMHYVFGVSTHWGLYPAGGLGYTSWGGGHGHRFGKLCVNLGGGAEYKIDRNWAINGELKYQIIDNYNQVVAGIGFTRTF